MTDRGWTRRVTEPGHVLVDRLRAPGARETRPTGSVAGSLFGGAGWPESALQTALGTRLRLNLDTAGSPLFAYSWEYVPIGMGPPILRRAGAGLGNGLYQWPTPLTTSPFYKTAKILRGRIRSPLSGGDGTGYGLALPEAAQLSGLSSLDELTDALILDRGPLNPEMARWLMGFPEVWSELASGSS